MRGPLRRWEWAAIVAITAGAAVLRLIDLGGVAPDPFYDAAVRSMSASWHNFFLGAFEPGGSVSIDKPPVDLWLQVASVKLLGFSSTTLKLPEAFAGITSVPLLFAAVRRIWSPAAALAAAVGMAVLPVEVITARSDTMDAVMMALLVLALLFVARAADDGGMPWLLAAAAALGLAFNVKLLESLVALPGIVVFAYFGLPGKPGRRLVKIGLAGLVYVAVSLSWLTATLLVPAHERPFAIGSSNGSAWNAAFVFNGTERLGGKSPEPQFTVYEPGHKYPVATQTERDHIPITPPSATRLLTRIGPLSGERLGMEVLVALLLGIPALLWGVLRPDDLDEVLDAESRARSRRRRPRERRRTEQIEAGEGARAEGRKEHPAVDEDFAQASAAVAAARAPSASPGQQQHAEPASSGVAVAGREQMPPRPPGDDGGERPPPAHERPAEDPRERAMRLRRATAAGIGLWMLSGLVLFSNMARLHPRYVEGFTPAVAVMFGIGVAWAASPKGRWRLAFLAATLVASVVYAERLLYGRPGEWWLALVAAIAALALAMIARTSREGARGRWLLAPAGVMALTLVAVLVIPFGSDTRSIETHVTDAGYVGALPAEEQRLVSSYLRAHQGSAYYETASLSATQIGSLIVQDGRPILVLTTYGSRVFTPVARLKQLIAQGKVRYAFLNSYCSSRHGGPLNPACSEPAKWVREHGVDVSRKAGLGKGKILWLLPGAKQ